MTQEQESLLQYTVSHFEDIARQNRFPENGSIAHDRERCLVCHPERATIPPFAVYLEVIAQSVKVRRPSLDQELVDAINGDRQLMGISKDLPLEDFLLETSEALDCWSDWLRDALNTGLSLLSIHSPSSLDFDLDDPELAEAFSDLIQEKIQEIMDHQKSSRAAGPVPEAGF
ncbi:hypothetical protein [Desulforhabdus sp. TSK]|uniref:hypothetical protein n=1 Tax=Desulforhabdus sp. TSK TaxID=2925014 RepID=UPI001FC89E74|nr:hypothetical protein [Desulforhabdus sp. TSK]GKT08461.1 hypothetical protein DSTSK_17660 [Desulforhabdus sp. TSK]